VGHSGAKKQINGADKQAKKETLDYLGWRMGDKPRVPNAEQCDDQGREPLRELWGKVWSYLPPVLGAALLPADLQGLVPRQKREGPCPNAKMVWPDRREAAQLRMK
jgi:hypothetical protein